jgi:hypothetical protein
VEPIGLEAGLLDKAMKEEFMRMKLLVAAGAFAAQARRLPSHRPEGRPTSFIASTNALRRVLVSFTTELEGKLLARATRSSSLRGGAQRRGRAADQGWDLAILGNDR